MFYKFKFFILTLILISFLSVFWYLQSKPFLDGQDFQATLVTYQGFLSLRYVTGYYLMIFLPFLYIFFPDIKDIKLIRYKSRLPFFYQRLRKSFFFSLGFSVILCAIVAIGTSIFFDVSRLINQHFYLAILFQTIQFTFVYGIISNLSNILLDISNNVVISTVSVVVVFILLTNIIYFELDYSFFFAEIHLINYVIKNDWLNFSFLMRLIRICSMFIITSLISRYIFLLRDIR
ncbi:WxPxxD family membrane protein [Niallia sp.]|uniref:WxPxxD family membrane protein n=1 Tax=Niallia sp. TaxID=2837523 RepID=UPI002898BF0D|nr:WxPxxD family membrane protein [Niallia sp.]